MNKARIAAMAAAGMLVPLESSAQEWSFTTFPGEGTPWQQTTVFRLTEPSPGQHRARFIIGGTEDLCIRAELKATVQDQAQERIVFLAPAMTGCPERRLVLKSDGSGGRMEVKQADGSWQWDERERGLTRR
jgi:hypothetical protein